MLLLDADNDVHLTYRLICKHMTEKSSIGLDTIIPAAVGIDTVWLALLSYWASTRIGELTARIVKLEAELKTSKKRHATDTKAKNVRLRDIEATLREHDKRLLAQSGTKQGNAPSPRGSRQGGRAIREESPSEDTHSDTASTDTDEDLSGVYNAKRRS